MRVRIQVYFLFTDLFFFGELSVVRLIFDCVVFKKKKERE
jgi:hypothetical protein